MAIELVYRNGGGSGAVNSVNGKSGNVILTAADVGALPEDTYIPSIDGLASEDFVKQEILEAQLSGGEVDLSAYALKTELPSIEGLASENYVDSAIETIELTPGPKGEQGPKGESGFSPVVTLEEFEATSGRRSGVRIVVQNENGVESAAIQNGATGARGESGKDGVSPTIDVSKTGNATTLTITDATGTKTTTIYDGAEGTGTGESSIPSYVEAEAERVMKLVQSHQNANTLTFITCGDIHLPVPTHAYYTDVKNGLVHAGQAMGLIKKRTFIDFAFNSGDLIWDVDETADTAMETMRFVHEVLADGFNGVQFWAYGNHDDGHKSGANLTEVQTYANIGAWNKGNVYNSEDRVSGYCYRDFEDYKVRVICINTGTGYNNVSDKQNNWLKNALNVPFTDGWGTILLSHCPLDWNGGEATSSTNIMSTIKAANGVICAIHGHTHAYQIGTLTDTNIPSISIPNICFRRNNEYGQDGNVFGDTTTYNKTAGTETDTAFSIITIDRETGELFVDYYGARPEDSRTVTGLPTWISSNFVNLVTTAESADSTTPFGEDYNGDGVPDGYKNGFYCSSSGGESEDSNCVVTGYIPYTWSTDNIIYIKGAALTSDSHVRIYGYSTKGGAPHSATTASGTTMSTHFNVEMPNGEDTLYYKLTPVQNRDISYIRFSLIGTGENLIITVKQPIE